MNLKLLQLCFSFGSWKVWHWPHRLYTFSLLSVNEGELGFLRPFYSLYVLNFLSKLWGKKPQNPKNPQKINKPSWATVRQFLETSAPRLFSEGCSINCISWGVYPLFALAPVLLWWWNYHTISHFCLARRENPKVLGTTSQELREGRTYHLSSGIPLYQIITIIKSYDKTPLKHRTALNNSILSSTKYVMNVCIAYMFPM